MAHAVIELNAVAAKDVDALNRSVTCATADLDSGNVFTLASKSTAAGQSQVWLATAPATGALTNLWMAGDTQFVDTITSTGQTFRNIDANPLDAYFAQGTVFSAFKPQVGDLITMTQAALTGAAAMGSNTYATAANGVFTLTPGAAAIEGLSLKLIATTYITIGNGGLGNTQRTVAYQFEVVAI